MIAHPEANTELAQAVAAQANKRRRSARSIALRVLLHIAALVVALACLAAYEHFSAEGSTNASIASLAGAAAFGFVPLRDVFHLVFGIEGRVLHLVHGIGGLALGTLPLTGFISGTPVLTHAALAPFALMGAAQAMMHQNHPRNAAQAAALRRFAEALPQVATFTKPGSLTTPENARRAVAVLSDLIGKAQQLGQTELDADPAFQSALERVSTRVGTNLGLDAVDMALGRLARNPTTAAAVPELRFRLAAARRTVAATAQPGKTT